MVYQRLKVKVTQNSGVTPLRVVVPSYSSV